MSSALRQTTRWMFGLLCLSILLVPGWASAQIPIPTLSISAYNIIPPTDPAHITVSEGQTITFRMELNEPTSQDVTLNYATDYITAFGGSDYVTLSGSARIPAGSMSYDLDLQILDDLVAEEEETFTLRFSNVAGALLNTPLQVTIHINASDEIGFNGFPYNNPLAAESNSIKKIYITYNGGSPVATVNYAVTAGTATAGSDFTPISGTVTFESGWLFQEIQIPIKEDGLNEGPETLIVTLTNPQGASLGTQSTYTVTILANDLLGFTTSSADVYEVAGQAQVQVRLNDSSAQEVRVNYATVDNTAQSVQDYTHVSGTLIFAPYETLKTITIPITTDGQNGELVEAFTVVLSNPVNAKYTKSSGRVSINIYDYCDPERCYQ